MNEFDLSVVIPAYNEEERLKKHIPAIQAHLAGKRFEIIVVNDGSRGPIVSRRPAD